MALLRLLDRSDELFFRHPFVDRFFEDDDELNLLHAVKKRLNEHQLRRAISNHEENPENEGNHKKKKVRREENNDGDHSVVPLSTSDIFSELSPLLGSDLVESETEYKIHVDLPGVEVADVDISLVDNKFLVIQAERKYVHEETKDKVHNMERSYGKVQRRFRLPANADVDKANTAFKNGVLTLSFPKKVISKDANVRKLQILSE